MDDIFPGGIFDKEGHFSGILCAFMYISITMGIKYFKAGIKQNYFLQREELKQIETELELLKSQVNPHFFFNSLNTLYALSLENSDDVPETILKLSDIMRYMLESSKDKQIKLEKEVEFLEKYLSLEKLRWSDKRQINFTITGKMKGSIIAPMLFIPFVEYMIGQNENSIKSSYDVDISLKVENTMLSFSIKIDNLINKKFSNQGEVKNMKRRLELLYPQKHKLEIIEDFKSSKLNLEIIL
jgi:LytS/YehU family sensor histidine kinase